MKVYKKLVRDKIPEIITSKGDTAITKVLTNDEFSEHLAKKLFEEVQEFLLDGTVEELADIYEVILAILRQKNVTFAPSSSVCSTNTDGPSHVLRAMGVPYSRARGALRLSFDDHNTLDEIQYICKVLPEAVKKLRNQNPEYIKLHEKQSITLRQAVGMYTSSYGQPAVVCSSHISSSKREQETLSPRTPRRLSS